MRILQTVLKNRTLSGVILRNIPVEFVRSVFGSTFLAPIQQFIHDGYNEKLFSNLALDEEGFAVVLGGYVGESSQYIKDLYGSRIYIFEPVPDFFSVLQNRFNDVPGIQIIQAAASNSDGNLELSVDGEKTGIGATGTRISVPAIDFAKFIGEQNLEIGVLEMNIEGGEYTLLPHLIETGRISNIKTILIQFHKYSMTDEVQRSLIREKLSVTHRLIFSYEWVWERWDLL